MVRAMKALRSQLRDSVVSAWIASRQYGGVWSEGNFVCTKTLKPSLRTKSFNLLEVRDRLSNV